MADNVFARNPPSRGINKFLQRNQSDYLSQTDDISMMRSISKFFNEAEGAVGLLEDKYRDQSRNREVQPAGTKRRSQVTGYRSLVTGHRKFNEKSSTLR